MGIFVFLFLLSEMFIFKSDKYFQYKNKYIFVILKPLKNKVCALPSIYFYEKYDYFTIIF